MPTVDHRHKNEEWWPKCAQCDAPVQKIVTEPLAETKHVRVIATCHGASEVSSIEEGCELPRTFFRSAGRNNTGKKCLCCLAPPNALGCRVCAQSCEPDSPPIGLGVRVRIEHDCWADSAFTVRQNDARRQANGHPGVTLDRTMSLDLDYVTVRHDNGVHADWLERELKPSEESAPRAIGGREFGDDFARIKANARDDFARIVHEADRIVSVAARGAIEPGETAGDYAVRVVHQFKQRRAQEANVFTQRQVSSMFGGDLGRAYGQAKRRAQEAPLVALVNDVPEGLDADGWRAAVLAILERWSSLVDQAEQRAIIKNTCARVAQMLQAGTKPIGIDDEAAHSAYARATTPAAPPPPAQTRLGGRALRLYLDHGYDD